MLILATSCGLFVRIEAPTLSVCSFYSSVVDIARIVIFTDENGMGCARQRVGDTENLP